LKKKEKSFFDYEEIAKVAYSPELARRLESITAAIFLSQFLFYFRVYELRHNKPIEWYFRDHLRLENDTGLNRNQQRGARKILRDKSLIQEKKGQGYKISYKINYSELDKYLPGCGFAQKEMVNITNRLVKTAQLVGDIHHLDGENSLAHLGDLKRSKEIAQKKLPFLFMEEIHKKIIEYRWPWKPKNWKPEKDKEAGEEK